MAAERVEAALVEWERVRTHPIKHIGEASHPERGTIDCVTLYDAEQIVAVLTADRDALERRLVDRDLDCAALLRERNQARDERDKAESQLREQRIRAAAAEAEVAVRDRMRQGVVCLCGSTKFKQAFREAEARFAMNGVIVLSVGLFGHADSIPLTVAEKAALDALHKRKIDLCTEVHVLNVGGYIGESTASEIAYAESIGQRVSYLEPSAVFEWTCPRCGARLLSDTEHCPCETYLGGCGNE